MNAARYKRTIEEPLETSTDPRKNSRLTGYVKEISVTTINHMLLPFLYIKSLCWTSNGKHVAIFWQDRQGSILYHFFFPGYFSAFMRALVLFQSAVTTAFGTYYSARATNNNVWTPGSKGLDKNIIQPYFFTFGWIQQLRLNGGFFKIGCSAIP